MWRRAARRVSLAGQTCASACHNRHFLQIATKHASDMPHSACITEILHHHDVMSFYDVMTSLMMSSPMHMWQVMSFGIKGAALSRGWFCYPRPSRGWTTQSAHR